MNYLLPTENLNLLQSLSGRMVTRVRRQLLLSDMAVLDTAIREQESDGPIELQFDNGTVISVVPDTERMSIELADRPMQQWGESYAEFNVTGNAFWSNRIGVKINRIGILVSRYASDEYPSEFGLVFILSTGLQFVIEYLSDEEHPDLLRVTERYTGPSCNHIVV